MRFLSGTSDCCEGAAPAPLLRPAAVDALLRFAAASVALLKRGDFTSGQSVAMTASSFADWTE